MNNTDTWLITGASSGLGAALSLHVLRAGHPVVATTRSVRRAADACPQLVAHGGVWAEVDPAQEAAQERVALLAEEHDVQVLVCNAGYAFLGGVEDMSEDELREQMEVNLYGPLRAMRGVLPRMRARRGGEIVVVSSGAGFIARPGRAAYSASKFAVEAITEALAQEVAPFGIKVLIVEPGAFRTPFSTRLRTPAAHKSTGGVSDAYVGTPVERMVRGSHDIKAIPDFVRGDPEKAARAIYDAVVGGHEYLRLPLGGDCVTALEGKIESLKSDLESTRSVAMAMDVED